MQRRMRSLSLSLISLCVLGQAHAIAPGFYLGFMGGPATNTASTEQAQTAADMSATVPASPRSTQVGTRAFMGYKSSPYTGIEFGMQFWSGIRYNTHDVDTCAAANARVRDIDLMGRLSYPFYGFEVFGKAGVALAYQTTGGAFNAKLNANPPECGESSYLTKWVPAFSIGAGYDLNQNWLLDFSVNRVNVSGHIGSMTTYALGLSYHFVDVYCGQFLCA